MTTLVTHNGKFHADDLFATAVLLTMLGKDLSDSDVQLIRTREEDEIAAGDYVYDVGGAYDADANRFDHHQTEGAGKRESGISYAAFGLVWKKFGADICGSQAIADRVDHRMVEPIDAHDNGQMIYNMRFEDLHPYTLSGIVGAFLPTWKEEREGMDERFEALVPHAQKLLEREIVWARDTQEAVDHVHEIFKKSPHNQVVTLDRKYPWEEVADEYPDVLYVTYPQDGLWRAMAVRKDGKTFETKKPFPKEWAGLRHEELQKVTGVPDALFCHNKLFTVATETEEGVRKLIELALNN